MRGDYVHLRALERPDLARTWEWLHRPDIHERLGVKIPFSMARQEQWFEFVQTDQTRRVLAICRNDNETHIGNASLSRIDFRHSHAGISLFIADKELRGRGYGGEALRLLIAYTFDYLNLHRLWCKINTEPPELESFYLKQGFKLEGRLREHEYRNGSYVDKKLLGLLKKEARRT